MKRTFKIGDTVALNSGGHLMTRDDIRELAEIGIFS
jgi:uncharacterized protein YodC (DUF2158 family)